MAQKIQIAMSWAAACGGCDVSLLDIEDALWIPGFSVAGTGALLFALIIIFHGVFGEDSGKAMSRTVSKRSQRESGGPGVPVLVSIIAILAIFSLFGMKWAGAPVGIFGMPEVLIIGMVVFAGFLAIRFVTWLSSAPPKKAVPDLPEGKQPMPNFLIALKCLAMVCFFACPILFIGYGMLDVEEMKFAGVVAPIVGGFIMAVVGTISSSKGYYDPEEEEKKKKK